MSIHPDGSGTGWTNVEAVDVNQPHGKDYLYSQHIAIGVRKRLDQEHSTFADATVGGIHTPGGCAVLGMEITDAVGDPTGAVIYDGTYRARGLVWSYVVEAGANKGVLFCQTDAAGTSTSAVDWTVMKLHPDLQWAGGDVTWAGAHEFDASVDISGNVAIDGDLTVDGTFTVGGDAAFHADASFDGTVDFGDAVAIVGDFSVDGTTMLQDTVVTGDVTFTFDAIAGETGPIFKIFGDWSTKTDATIGHDVTYTARTDGLVVAFGSQGGGGISIIGQTPAGTIRVRQRGPAASQKAGVTFPVKAGDTWAVTSDVTAWDSGGVYWLPFGDNT